MTSKTSRFLKASLVVAAMLVVQACFEGPESNPHGYQPAPRYLYAQPVPYRPAYLAHRPYGPAYQPWYGPGYPPGYGRMFGPAYRYPRYR